MTIHELQATPIAQPELQSKVATWLNGLSFPVTFELAADADGVRIRADGMADTSIGHGGFSSLTNQSLRWIPSNSKGLPAPDRAWVLKAESDLPTLHHSGEDPFLSWADRLQSATRALGADAEVALRIAVLCEDADLQRKLRALSAYGYGNRIDDDEPHLWALRLKLWRGLIGVGAVGTILSGGVTAPGWIPMPVGAVLMLAGVTIFSAGAIGWQRWLRTRNIPREILEHYASGPLLRAALLLTMRGGDSQERGEQVLSQSFASGMPFSGPVSKVELEPSMLAGDTALSTLESYALAVPGSDLAGLLTPAEDGDPAEALHPDTRVNVPAPSASPALRNARFRIGRAVASGEPIGIDPDGHGLIVGGSQSGKSSLASALLRRLLEDDDPPGLFLVDPHESLANSFLMAIDNLPPDERAEAIERLLVVTPDQSEVVPLNLLSVPDFVWGGNTLIQVGSRIWDDYWGPRMQAALQGLFRLGHAWNTRKKEPNERLALFHLIFIAFQPEWRKQAMKMLPPEARGGALALSTLLGQFSGSYSNWEQRWATEVVSPIISKVMAVELAPWLFQALHQPDFVDLEGAIEDRRWIVLRVPSGKLGKEASRLLSAVIYNVWEAAFRRVATAQDPIPYLVMVDEAQDIATGMELETLLAEGAKFGARLFVLTQSLSMLRQKEEFEALVQSLLANTSTQAFFSPDPDDADLIRDILSSRIRYGEMTFDLPSLAYWLRARLDGDWQPPVLAQSHPLPSVDSDDSERVEALVREVIAAHPHDYVQPEMGVQAALIALQQMVPERYQTLLGLAMGTEDVEDGRDGAATGDAAQDDDTSTSSNSEEQERIERLGLT